MKRSKAFSLVLALAASLVAIPSLAADPAKISDPRVESLLTRLGLQFSANSAGNAEVVYDEEKGRSQTVYIMSGTESYNGIEIREIWSNAGSFEAEPDAALLVELLVDSGKNKIGAWSLEEDDSGGYLLYYSMRFPADTSDEAYRMMLEFASSVADQAEADYFDGADEN